MDFNKFNEIEKRNDSALIHLHKVHHVAIFLSLIARQIFRQSNSLNEVKSVVELQGGYLGTIEIKCVADESIWLPTCEEYYGKVIEIWFKLNSSEIYGKTIHLTDPIEICGISNLHYNLRYSLFDFNPDLRGL